jgi:hypothetical protein
MVNFNKSIFDVGNVAELLMKTFPEKLFSKRRAKMDTMEFSRQSWPGSILRRITAML